MIKIKHKKAKKDGTKSEKRNFSLPLHRDFLRSNSRRVGSHRPRREASEAAR